MQTGLPDTATPFMPAPESALGFHPWIALSSAPAARSVSRIAIMSNKRTQKGIDFSSAFRHGKHLAAGTTLGRAIRPVRRSPTLGAWSGRGIMGRNRVGINPVATVNASRYERVNSH